MTKAEIIYLVLNQTTTANKKVSLFTNLTKRPVDHGP